MKIEHLIADNITFRCNTKEKATEFIKNAYSLGYKWNHGNENSIYYDKNGENTCYTLRVANKDITYGELSYFKKHNYTIIEYELDETEEKKIENKKLTPIEYIMQYLGVEENEEFNVLEINGSEWKRNCNPFLFDDGDLFDNYWDIRNDVLIELIKGTLIVGKLPWKPKEEEEVFIINCDGSVGRLNFSQTRTSDLARYKCGWLFKSIAEAKENKERVLSEYRSIKR